MNDQGKRLNWSEACALLGCSRSYFYSLVKAGKLTAYAVKGKKRGFWVLERDVVGLVRIKGQKILP